MAKTTTKIENVATKDPQQLAAIHNMISQLSPELREMFSTVQSLISGGAGTFLEQMKPIDEDDLRERFQRRTADPAMRQFREEIIPQIERHFTSSGGPGTAGSSGEQQALLQAGTRLSEGLANQFEDVRETALNRQLTAAQAGGQLAQAGSQSFSPFANLAIGTDTFQPVARQTTKQGPWEVFGSNFAQGAGKGISSLISGLF